MIHIGIDEAGRGAVIGPLVIALAAFKDEKLETLSTLITKDSKGYTRRRREELYEHIVVNADYISTRRLSPNELNQLMCRDISLNIIELRVVSELIKEALEKTGGRVTAYIDSMTTKEIQCKTFILSRIPRSDVRIICEHGADAKYPVVRAASIIAKVIRDRSIDTLEERYGNLGSGYPSDPRTIEALKRLAQELDKEEFGSIVRLKWKTVKRIIGERGCGSEG